MVPPHVPVRVVIGKVAACAWQVGSSGNNAHAVSFFQHVPDSLLPEMNHPVCLVLPA
jgi:hypothetical protein